ncbi:MAG: molybdopterin-guanine dinucleotide biosynthesis protein B [Candidatus Heimdallarchaeaceae archaeon]
MQVVGYSGSYKTSLISTLTKKLNAQGKVVATIKSARKHKLDNKMKDSEKHFLNGAQASVAVFEDAVQVLCTSQPLEKIINLLNGLVKPNIILIEGFKKEEYPKIILWSEELQTNPQEFNFTKAKYLFCSEERYNKHKEEIEQFALNYSLKLVTDPRIIIRELIEEL